MANRIYVAVSPNTGDYTVVDDDNPMDFYEVTAAELHRLEEDGWADTDKVLAEKNPIHVWPKRISKETSP